MAGWCKRTSRNVIPGRGARIFASGVCLALATVNPSPASEKAWTLDRLLEAARRQNPDLLAARAQLEVARGRLVRARYWNPFNPEIEGGAAARRFEGGGSESQAAAGLSIELEVAGQRTLRIREAKRNFERVEAEVADVERHLVADVTRAFYRALYLGEQLRLFERIELLNRRLYQASEERFSAGEAPKLEANLAAIRHDRAARDRLAAEASYRNALRTLERLSGMEPTGVLILKGSFRAEDVPLDEKELLETALASRPDLLARKHELSRLEAETRLTRRLILPNPRLGFEYDEEAESRGQRDRIFGVTLRFPIPIFDAKKAELTTLSGLRLAERHNLRAVELSIELEVRDALETFRAARKAVRAFESGAVERIEESLRLLETSYKEGKIGLLELLAGQNELVAARLAYLEALWDYWRARAELERAVGRRLPDRRSR